MGRLIAVAVLMLLVPCALPRLSWPPRGRRRGGQPQSGDRQAGQRQRVPRQPDDLDRRGLPRGAGHPLQIRLGADPEGLQKREDEIAGQIAEAQRKNEEARQLLADYEKKLAAAQDKVRGLIEQGRRDAEKVGQQLLDKAREEAGIERQRAVQQIESATLAALRSWPSGARPWPWNWPARSSVPGSRPPITAA